MNIIFFGTSSFAIPILAQLTASSLRPCLVVSTPDRARGRKLLLSPTPVKEWAIKNGVEVITPENLQDSHIIETLSKKNSDLFVIASYGKMIPKEILTLPPKGAINVHPSLLPHLRGPSPIQYTILRNETPGVTLMLTDEKVDHGPILKSENLKTKNEKITYKILEQKLAELGAKLLIEVIPQWMKGDITPKEQDHSKATFTKKIAKEDGRIDWNEPAEIIERKIRAFHPWPGTYAFWRKPQAHADVTQSNTDKKQRLIIIEAAISKDLHSGYPAGTVFETKNGDLAVVTPKNSLIITRIMPEGKKTMDGKDFLKGYSDILTQRLT